MQALAPKAYLAIDIGASSGRLMAAFLEQGRLKMEELHRFANGMIEVDGHFAWDLDELYAQIITALQKAHERGLNVQSIGIDTWGVDYLLLKSDGSLADRSYAYRDSRTQGMDDAFYSEVMPHDALYARNGIQKLIFNTVYQLYAHKKAKPELFDTNNADGAKAFLMMPDYLNYLLTGEIKNEYTNGTTAQLVDVNTNDWDYELIEKMGLDRSLFKSLCKPGTLCGRLRPEVIEKVGFDANVVMVGSHDTASAVVAAPLFSDDHIYLSSGTWSLMGVERLQADCSMQSFEHNFTNEGGYDYRFRYLKNIMGLWILQNLRKELPKMSFSEIYELAAQGVDYDVVVDVNDSLFLNPASMKQAFVDYCEREALAAPKNDAQVLYCAYHSLACSYKQVVAELESVTKKSYKAINIIGGGCQDQFLNSFIAKETGKKILTGPIEATALGNIVVQMIRDGALESLDAARHLIADSFEIAEVKA